MRFTPVLLLLLSCPAFAQELKLPEKVSGPPGAIVVEAVTDCKIVQWVAIDKGISVVPPDLLRDSKKGVFIGVTPGQYRVLAYTCKADMPSAPAYCLIVVEGAVPPVPPSPPTPPTPPTPTPDPPTPDSPLVTAMKAAFAKEAEADKKHLPTLVKIFRTAATYADDERNKTTKDINDMVKSVRESQIGQALPNVRAVANNEAKTVLTNEAKPLTPELRASVKAVLTRLADALSAVPQPAAAK